MVIGSVPTKKLHNINFWNLIIELKTESWVTLIELPDRATNT
jgi:hypothetical protein